MVAGVGLEETGELGGGGGDCRFGGVGEGFVDGGEAVADDFEGLALEGLGADETEVVVEVGGSGGGGVDAGDLAGAADLLEDVEVAQLLGEGYGFDW